jgi:uncharacterized protein (DUF1501 family)
MWTRRQALASLAAGTALLGTPIAFARTQHPKRLVVVLLRGGLDGLATVIPHGDPHYVSARGAMAMSSWMDLDGQFGLHPAMEPLMPLWRDNELLAVHAVATPYRRRSHFDAQDVLETGVAESMTSRDGWLNRALMGFDGPTATAVGSAIPLVLRGGYPATSVDPLRDKSSPSSFLDLVEDLYVADPALATAAAMGRETQENLPQMGTQRGRPRRDASQLAEATGRMMATADGPNIAVLELGGWDTHNRQGLEEGQLAQKLGSLASGLVALKTALAGGWADTTVVVLTEFGRTVRGNGTGGTDHGTGAVALLAGGAVAGGRVVTDWPGLSEASLHEHRDLRPTTDIRSVLKGVLGPQLGLSTARLNEDVFPDSGSVPSLQGLLRLG